MKRLLAVAVVVAALLAATPSAQSPSTSLRAGPSTPLRQQLGARRPGSGPLEVFDARSDQHQQRPETAAGVDVPHRRQIRLLRKHAAGSRRRHVRVGAERRLRAGPADRRPAMEIRDQRCDAARPGVLAGRRRDAPAASCVVGPESTGASIRKPASSRQTWTRGFSSWAPRWLAAVGLQGRPHHAGQTDQ